MRGEPMSRSLLWDKSWAPPLFIFICIPLNWCLLFLWDCSTSSRQSYLPKCILFTPFPGGAVDTAGKQVTEPLGEVPPVPVQGMLRSALLSSSDEQWQPCKLIVWITGTARAAVTRFTGQICSKRALVSSLTDAWVWTVASSARKKPTNLSCPVIPPVGKEPTRVPGERKGDLITLIPSSDSAQAELALPEWGEGGCKRHWELLCCVWEGSKCVKMPACHTGNAGYGLCLCLGTAASAWQNNGTAWPQESLGIICGCGNGHVVPPSSYCLTCNMGLQNKARRRNNLCCLSPALKLLP